MPNPALTFRIRIPHLWRFSRALFLATLFAVAARALPAQVVRGTVLLADALTRVPGVIVQASKEGGPVARTLTSDRGEFVLRLPAEGRYSLRVLRIGYRPSIGPTVTVAAGATETVRVLFNAESVTLSTVTVRGQDVCRVHPDSGLMVARVWEEARKAILTTQLSSESVPLFAEWIEYDRTLDATARLVREQHVRTSRNPTTHAFRSLPAETLTASGYVVTDSSGTMFYAPDADVLLSDSFAAAHCLRLEESPAGRTDLIGVGFQPTRDRRDVPDIEGTFWLDRKSAELRTLEFRYANLPDAAQSVGAGGRVEFLRLGDGNWLVSRWNARLPRLGSPDKYSEGGLRRLVMSATAAVVKAVQVAGGEVTQVMRGDSLVYAATGASLSVQVISRDALVGAGGATVTLVGTDYAATADVAGRVRLSPVLDGRYRARVLTPLMDALGMQPVERDIEVRMDAHVDSLALPSARDVVLKACPRESMRNGEGMLRGTVRDAQGGGVPHAAVTVTWQANISLVGMRDADHLQYSERTVGALTDDTGRWRVCGVPRETALIARVVADSGSDWFRAQLAGDQPFAVVELVVHHEAVGTAGRDWRPRALVELVVTDIAGAPLTDAMLVVSPPGGPPRTLTTGPSGRALVPDVAAGVLTVEAKRIGFKPGKLAVAIEAGRNTVPIILSDVSLPSLEAVRIVGGKRVAARLDEFESRRLNHIATASITRDEIVKRNPVDAWQMLTNVPSVTVVEMGGLVFAKSDRGFKMVNMQPVPCFYRVMVDGVAMAGDPEGRFNLNLLPRPDEIQGIEVFAGPAAIPLQYGGSGGDKWCGLIAIWTR